VSKETATERQSGGLSLRAGGLFTSASLIVLGGIVMIGSLEQGIGWDDAGPQAGYFPFYIGLLLALSSLGTAFNTLRNWRKGAADLTTRAQLGRVLAVLIPICVFVALMPAAGMYVSSALFIAWFMWRMAEDGRRYSLKKILAVSIGVPIAAYFIFTAWFEVPLYAGPFAGWLTL